MSKSAVLVGIICKRFAKSFKLIRLYVNIIAKVLLKRAKNVTVKKLPFHSKDFESTQVKIEKETCRMNCANMCLMVIFITKT